MSARKKAAKTTVLTSKRATDPSCSVGSFLEFLLPFVWDSTRVLNWPPDVFAAAASVLQRSGGYTSVVKSWPPREWKEKPPRAWPAWIKDVGRRWRKSEVDGTDIPIEVMNWWEAVQRYRDVNISRVATNEDLWEALVQLCAAADEACEGVGIPSSDGTEGNSFEVEADERLIDPSLGTLCREIHPTRARVLPKLHTPQNGLTIRSLSHNLALCPAGEIQPQWYRAPMYQGHCLNLLVLPWPETIEPAQFKAVTPRCGSLDMRPERGFFTFVPKNAGRRLLADVRDLLDKAKKLVGRIDGVVLPELALTPSQRQAVSELVLAENAFLISGISEAPSDADRPGRNYLVFDLPIGENRMSITQYKHHRWKLDANQIRQYGLGTELDPSSGWWEHMAVEAQSLVFVAMRPWLTISALICEDLARQDPMADVVRAVGPNLVIALLMDAPQLASRWPARYATVLADDPGSSVLTVTSLGMAQLSRPFGVTPRSRVIALWKDARAGVPIEIELEQGKRAAILNLTVTQVEEYTADGRSDGGSTGYPVLSGVHFV